MPKTDKTLKKVGTVIGATGNTVAKKTANGFVKTGRIIKTGGHIAGNIVKNSVNKAYNKPNVQNYVTIQEKNKQAKAAKKAERKLKRQAKLAALLQESK